jgi:hypothetical protein
MSVTDSLKINGYLRNYAIQRDSDKNLANLNIKIKTESNEIMALTLTTNWCNAFSLACCILENKFSNPDDDYDTTRWNQMILRGFIDKAKKEIKKHRLTAEKQKLEDQISKLD